MAWIQLIVASVCLRTVYPNPYQETHFNRDAGFLHNSAEPEVTCPGRPCSVAACASVCAKNTSCMVFSHSPTKGTCVMAADVTSVADPSWNTYYKQDCPLTSGYAVYGDHLPNLCLKYVAEPYNYVTADNYCMTDGARLVRVKTLAIFDTVMQLLADSGEIYEIWVGADDLAVEGEHYWNDGTPLLLTDPLWGDPSGGTNKDCTTTHGTLKLEDYPCSNPKTFICQYGL